MVTGRELDGGDWRRDGGETVVTGREMEESDWKRARWW